MVIAYPIRLGEMRQAELRNANTPPETRALRQQFQSLWG
jgi:hypothetical protein